MAINQFFDHFSRLFRSLKNSDNSSKILNLKSLIYLFSFISFVSIFIFISNFVEKKNERENQNFDNLIKTNEFLNLTDYLITKINNPYKEINYLIQRNDSIEKILNKLEINSSEVKDISNRLKQEKLTNIYAGRTLSIVLKKSNDGTNSVINLLYPVNNTLSLEIRKNQNNFIVKKNIL